MRCVTKK
jgi:hypothetical protein